MKPGKFTHAIAVILSSISSLFAHGTGKKRSQPKQNSAKSPTNRQTTIQSPRLRFRLSRANYLKRDRTRHSVIRGKAISSQRSFGSVSNLAGIISPQIAPAHGTNNGQKTTAALTIRIPRIEAITFLRNSHRNRIHSTARCRTTIRRAQVIDLRHHALFPGFEKRTKAPAFLLAKIDGSPFAKAIGRFMPSGKMPVHSALIIGNTCSAMSAPNPI